MINGNISNQLSASDLGAAEQLKEIIENINGGVSVVVYGIGGKVRLAYANDRYYEMLGYTREQFVSELTNPHDVIYPDDTAYVGSMIDTVKATHKASSFKYRAVKRDGRMIYIRCSSSVTAISGIEGSVLISVLSDITSSEEPEQTELMAGERLREIMDNISNGVTACTVDKDGNVQYVFSTDRYYSMLGYTREQYHEEITDPFKLIYGDDAESVSKICVSLDKPGETKTLQFRVIRRDGSLIWQKCIVTLIHIADVKEPVQLSVFTDITALKETEEQYRMQHEQMLSLINSTPGGIAVVEVNTERIPDSLRIAYYNDRFFAFSGYSKDEYVELLKRDPLYFAFKEDTHGIITAMEKLCAGEIGDSTDITVRCHTKGGDFRWLLLKEQLVKKQGGHATVHVLLIDITERKIAIDKQRISEEMFRIAAETDKRALITYDVKANTCHVESRNLFSAKYGSSLSDIPDSLIELGIAAPESVGELTSLFRRIRQGEKEISVTLQLRTGMTEYQWFECNAAVVFDADGKPDHAVLVFHNITEQRVKEAIYRKWRQSIETRPPESFTLFRCNLSRDASLDERDGELLKIRFTADEMSFNARTKLYAEQFVYPDDRESYIAMLDSDALLAMFYRGKHDALLEYRETGTNGELSWRRLNIELVEYLNSSDVQAFLMYEDINEWKIAELKEKEMAETDPLTGVLNRTAFSQKVDELIGRETNSQHAFLMLDLDGFKRLNDTFGHAAGDQALMDVTAVLRSVIREGDFIGRLGGDEFLIWLRGIPYDAVIGKMAQQICEQVHKGFSNEVLISASVGVAVYPRDGHGFDELYHKADKALYSVKQAGKNNYAFFSASEAESPAKATVEPDNTKRAVTKTKRRMLIVDDNETNRLMLSQIFRDEYQIELAKNGADAMVQLRHFSTAINVVLLDLIMPGMDGFEVLGKMRDNVDLSTIPVIVVSGDDDHKTLIHAIGSGAADFVTKPVDPELIRIRVKSAVSKADNERLRAQNSYLQLQRDEELKFHIVLESTGTVVVEYDWRNHVFIYDNTISKYIAGNYNNRSIWSVFLTDMVTDSQNVKALQEMMHMLANDREKCRASKLVQLKTPEKVKHWFRMNVYKQVDAFGLAEKMIITFNDVNDDVLANDKLMYQAQRDELTGLYNRYGFIEKATELINSHKAGYYVLTCVDIERFKVINDQYGTQRGDEVLRKLAAALVKLYEADGGICCRVTADNFAALFPKQLLDNPKIEQAHRDMVHLDGASLPIKFTIGRCAVDDKSLDVSAVYDRACMAKDSIKGRYDQYIAVYDESMRTALLRQQEIIGQMNHALESGQFEVWFQPQFNHSSGKLCGAEALVRWRHPKEGIISPAEFIPLFERNGFVYEVDKYVWEQTCVSLRKWLDQGQKPVPISVNISRYDVFRDDLISIISGLVKKYDLPLDLLRLEITESAFSESTKQIIDVVNRFVELGFIVEIDDFGSGYSSLNTLKDVPAQIIKMDMRFLENDTNAQRGGSIIESVVRMARWLGMTIIAEGVETIDQADYLRSIGCDYIQGYLYSRPIQAAEYEKLFANSQTESQYGNIQSVETWNNNAFWNPKSMESLIFNSYVGGACIFEYNDGAAEILRTNKDFRKELRGLIADGERLNKTDFSDILNNEHREVIHATVMKAAESKEQASCELIISRNGHTEYIRATIRLIATADNRMLFYGVILNMTEQREAEHKQLESAQQLEIIMGNINGGVSALIISDDGRSEAIFANERYYEIFGYTGEQAREEHLDVMTLILPEDFPQVMEQLRKLKKDRVPTAIDYRCKRRDGHIIYLRENCAMMHMDRYGEDVFTSVLTDITEQRELNDKFRAVVDNINGGVSATFLREDKPEYVVVNDRYYDIIGYTKEQFEAEVSNIFDLVYPDDRARVEAQFREAAVHQGKYTMEYRFIRRDGEIRNILCNTNVLHLFGVDEPVQLAVSNDITELREAQKNELATADKLRTVMQHAGNGITAIALHEDAPEFIFVNDKYFEIIGYTRDTYHEMTANDLFSPIYEEDKERVRRLVTGVNSSSGTITLEYRVRQMNGNVVWIRSVVTITELSGFDCHVQIAIFSDITAEKESIEQLKFLNDSAHDILAQPNSDNAINDTLRNIVDYFNCSRAYVMEDSPDRTVTHCTYEVCADGIPTVKAERQNLRIGMAQSRADEYVAMNDIETADATSAEFRRMLLNQGVTSTIIIPLHRDGVLFGTIGIDNPHAAWEKVRELKALGDYIAVLITRRDLTNTIQREKDAMRQLIDDTPGGFCRMAIHPDAHPTLVTMNVGFCRMLGMTDAEVRTEYGDDMFRCLTVEDIQTATENSKDAHFDGGQFTTKCRLRKKDGGFVWTMVFGRFANDEAGNVYLNSYFTDITEQIKAEELQKQLLDNMPNGAALYEFDGKTMSAIHINKRYWQLVEREPVNYYRKSVLGVIHPDDSELVNQEIAAAIRQKRDVSVNLRILCGKSEYKPFHVAAIITPGTDGKYLFYASYTPISEETMSIQEIIPIAISTMMSTSSNISYIKDKDMHFICCSKSLVEMLGLESERDVIGKSTGDLFAPEYAGKFDADDRKVIETGESVIDVKEHIPTAENKVRLMQTSKYPVLDAKGKVAGVYCLSIDITAQYEKESRLELLTRTIPGGLASYAINKSDIQIRYFNDGYYKFSGYTREEFSEVVAKDNLALVADEDKANILKMLDECRANMTDGYIKSCTCRCHTKNGEIRWMNLAAVISELGENHYILNVAQTDITEQKEVENRQKELLDNLPCGAALYRFDGMSISAVHINKQYEKMTGRHTNSANTSLSPMKFIHPDDRQVVLTEIEEAIRENREAACDIRILYSENNYRTFRVNAHITKQPDGTYSLYVTYSEISEKEFTFRETVPFILSTIMESSTDLAFAKDRDFRYLVCSKFFAEFLGFDSEEKIIGKTDYELFPKDIADRFRHDDSVLLADGKPIIDLAESIPTKDGRLNYTRMSKHILRNTTGEIIGLYGNGRDITESKEAYEQLKLMTNSISGGLASFICSPEEIRLTYCNDGFCRLFDIPRESYESSTFGNPINYVVEADRPILAKQYHAMMADGTPIDCIYRIHAKNGGYRWVHHRALVSDRHNDIAFVNAVLFDITEQQNEKERLALHEEEYRLATEHSGRAICRYSISDHTMTITPEVSKRLGIPEKLEDIPYGRVRAGAISPDTSDTYIAFFEAINHGEKEATAVFQKHLPSGWRWISANATTVFAENNAPLSAIISFADVTDEQEKEAVYKKWNQALQDRKDETYTLFRCNLNKNTSCDTREGTLLDFWHNDDVIKTFNERTQEFAQQCVVSDDRDRYMKFVNSDSMLASYHRGKRADTLDFRAILSNGEIHWLRLSVELVGIPNSTDVEAYMMYENIDEQKQTELMTRQLAETDPLTGLLNRKAFAERVNERIAKHGANARHAFFMLDIDGFKMLNDIFGHAAGDEALIEVSRKLETLLRQDDLLGRLGGDEFVVFIENITGKESIEKKAQQICSILYKSYNMEVSISASVGISRYPQDGTDCHTLYSNADMALYTAKESGRNTYSFYNNAMSARRDTTAIDEHRNERKLSTAPMKRRMLIVDDNELDRQLLANMFNKEFIVDFALDGASALSRMRYYGSALSVVLLDLFMQGMTGFDVLEKAQNSPEMHNVPIIVVSADDNRETSMRAIRAGATDFINKPVEPELIRLRVDAVVSRAENERLRAQNSHLQFIGNSNAKYEAVMNQLGITVIELDWVKGTFTYDPSISQHLKGNYDGRTLWRVLLSDMVADADTVQKIQQTIHSLADDRSRSNDCLRVQLRTPSNKKHWFTLNTIKLCNDAGLADRIVITLLDMDTAAE